MFCHKLEPGDYDDLPTALIFRALVDGEREGAAIDFDFLSKKTEGDPISELLPSLLMSEAEVQENVQFEARQLDAQRCIDALRLMNVDRRISDLRSEIAVAERNGETERRDRLSIEQLELTRRRDGLAAKSGSDANWALAPAFRVATTPAGLILPKLLMYPASGSWIFLTTRVFNLKFT